MQMMVRLFEEWHACQWLAYKIACLLATLRSGNDDQQTDLIARGFL